MMEAVLFCVVGLALLAVGGEGLVRGAVGIARRAGLSELMIGLTLVGFGTSTPELVTSLNAAAAGAPGIALGNVLGSNIGNILLVFALVVLIRPVAVDRAATGRDGILMVAVSAILTVLCLITGEISRLSGALLVAGLLGYLVMVWRQEQAGGPAADLHKEEAHTHDPVPQALWISLLFSAGGLAMLVLGADLLVQGAVSIARTAGVSETVIGLTIVAIGTSLPELVATLVAALKGRADVAFGSIVGSNLYNILGILGITALFQPIPIPADLAMTDWLALVGSAVLLAVFAWTGSRLSRREAAVMLALYGCYLWTLFGV